ncbi:MAG: M24 family metallopeptidase [Parvibaculaceae bacterium]
MTKMFATEEHEARIAAVRKLMAQAGADALLVDSLEHMVYLFGYAPPAAIYQCAVLPQSRAPFAIVRRLDEPTFREQSWLADYTTFSDVEDPIDALQRAISDKGLSRAAIAVELDSHFLPVGRFRSIEKALPDARFIDFSGRIRELRLIKSERELAYIRQAAVIADRAMHAAVEAAGAGVSERECAAALYAEALRAGADNGRNALIASGKRSDSLHGRLGSHTLEEGDVLHVESLPLVGGYGARLMRSTSIGTPSSQMKDDAKRLIEYQDRQFEEMKPGASASAVDARLRDAVLKSGLRDRYDNVTGYTLGFIGLPVTSDFTRAFKPESSWSLEPGMVFHMYTYAKGLAFSDTVAITRDGAEIMTKTPRRLFVR